MALGPVEETSLASNAQFGVEIALAPTLASWHGYRFSAVPQTLRKDNIQSRADFASGGCTVNVEKLAADGYLTCIHQAYYKCAFGSRYRFE